MGVFAILDARGVMSSARSKQGASKTTPATRMGSSRGARTSTRCRAQPTPTAYRQLTAGDRHSYVSNR